MLAFFIDFIDSALFCSINFTDFVINTFSNFLLHVLYHNLTDQFSGTATPCRSLYKKLSFKVGSVRDEESLTRITNVNYRA